MHTQCAIARTKKKSFYPTKKKFVNNKSGDFRVTHQAPFKVVVCFVFCDVHTYLSTDTMCENNDHLFGHQGLVDQLKMLCLTGFKYDTELLNLDIN